MRIKRHLFLSFVASAILAPFVVFAAKPSDFSTAQIDEIWKELWKSGDSNLREPKVEKLSEHDVIERMTGKWTVMFGVMPDELTIKVSTNSLVEVSGQKDGKDWRKTGEWRVVSDKLVLFLEQDDLPGFIFRTQQRSFILDPWAKTMMSELKPPQFCETESSDAFQKHYPVRGRDIDLTRLDLEPPTVLWNEFRHRKITVLRTRRDKYPYEEQKCVIIVEGSRLDGRRVLSAEDFRTVDVSWITGKLILIKLGIGHVAAVEAIYDTDEDSWVYLESVHYNNTAE